MKIQVNSDKAINVDASLMRIVKEKSTSALERFAKGLTRVEIHLSDIDNKKTGPADKRCLIEVRPAGDQPLAASALAKSTEEAVDAALRKMKRALTTFFGKKGRTTAKVAAAPASNTRKKGVSAKKAAVKQSATKKAAAKKPTKLSPRGPKKKMVYQGRRKSWPR
jgi:ribosome-associated translation inhibitor RaiA